MKHLLLVYLRQEPDSGYRVRVRAWSRSRDGGRKLSPHFAVREFACRDGSDPVFVAERLPQVLEQLRERFGQPVRITSGYRTPGYNRRVGGKAYSQHLYGCAADIVIPGVDPETVGRAARQLMPDFGGVGVYPEKGFTHVDVRERRADWTA